MQLPAFPYSIFIYANVTTLLDLPLYFLNTNSLHKLCTHPLLHPYLLCFPNSPILLLNLINFFGTLRIGITDDFNSWLSSL